MPDLLKSKGNEERRYAMKYLQNLRRHILMSLGTLNTVFPFQKKED
jgi:hypothetical protein